LAIYGPGFETRSGKRGCKKANPANELGKQMGNNSKYVERMLEMGILRKSNNWIETATISLKNTGQREKNREGNKTGRLPNSLTPLTIM
jgi:hypothetical protein